MLVTLELEYSMAQNSTFHTTFTPHNAACLE
jgi:hypothetical protein